MAQKATTNSVQQEASAYLKARLFLKSLKNNDQYLTLRGQALAGDIEGAMKGLEVILRWRE